MPLNLLEPTRTKEKLLRETYASFLGIVKEALGFLGGVKSRAELHKRTYDVFRGKYDVASQLAIEATSYAWSIRKTADEDVGKCVVRFDKRLFSLKETKRGNPALSLRLNDKRVGIPIRQDGAYRRLQQHLKDGRGVTSIIMRRDLKFLAALSKESPEFTMHPTCGAATFIVVEDDSSYKSITKVVDVDKFAEIFWQVYYTIWVLKEIRQGLKRNF